MSTTLDAYLKRESVSEADFAERIKRDRSMVNKLRRGIVRPTLDLAAAIEAATDGDVPMHAWVVKGAEPTRDAA